MRTGGAIMKTCPQCQVTQIEDNEYTCKKCAHDLEIDSTIRRERHRQMIMEERQVLERTVQHDL